jgi:hypothetical protein
MASRVNDATIARNSRLYVVKLSGMKDLAEDMRE